MGKPATILLHLTEIEKIKDKYSIVLKVDDKLVKTNCTRNLKRKDIEKSEKDLFFRERHCELTNHNFISIKRNNIKDLYHFVEIPTKDKITGREEEKKITVSIENQSNKSCFVNRSFPVVMRNRQVNCI